MLRGEVLRLIFATQFIMTFQPSIILIFSIEMQPIYPISKQEVSMNLNCNFQAIDSRRCRLLPWCRPGRFGGHLKMASHRSIILSSNIHFWMYRFQIFHILGNLVRHSHLPFVKMAAINSNVPIYYDMCHLQPWWYCQNTGKWIVDSNVSYNFLNFRGSPRHRCLLSSKQNCNCSMTPRHLLSHSR